MYSQILVTGAASFIGSHVCKHLIKSGHTVIRLDDLNGGFRDYVPDGVKCVEDSVADTALVKKLFTENNFDYVFHLAAYAAEGLSHFIKHFNYANNLLDCCGRPTRGVWSATLIKTNACRAGSRK